MSITNPTALWLFLLLPVFIWIGWPRLAYRRRRDAIALGLRLVLVTLLILALAGLEARQEADKLAVVFVVDLSESVEREDRVAALDYVEQAIGEMSEDDQAALVVFGSNGLVEYPIEDRANLKLVDLNLDELGSKPDETNTDLAEAIRLGMALFPADTAKRMVIISDGLETVGDAAREAQLAAATGVQIDYFPLSREMRQEVILRDLRVPSVVNEGERFELSITIESTSSTGADLAIEQSGSPINPNEPIMRVELEPGVNRFAVPVEAGTTGVVDFSATVTPDMTETFDGNNSLDTFTRVIGDSRILLVTSDTAEIQFLQDALAGDAENPGFDIDVMAPGELPMAISQLTQYDSILLANVSATELNPTRMEILESYVRDLGGGLVVVGGDQSYGVGGYFQTPLEDALPVEMRIRDKERVPTLTMVFVLDRSGSMQVAGASGYSNLELAKEAVLRSFDFLRDDDKAGVASFDSQTQWVVEIQEIGGESNRQALSDQVSSLRPGGGTDIYNGLVAVRDILPGDDSALKHIILLTDGGANPQGIPALIGRLYDRNDITTSVIAVGENSAPWLRDVARVGNGNFNLTTDVATIPSIFAAETVIATRSYIADETFQPQQTARSPIMEGFSSVPTLDGYIITTPKDTATIILENPAEEDPILASWQYGLGRSVAFTSDATSRWGSNWVSWDGYEDFWRQVLSWTITEGRDSNTEVWVEQRGDQAVLVVDARDEDGGYLNSLQLGARIFYPDSGQVALGSDNNENTNPLIMQQVAPGRYELPFIPTDKGVYFFGIGGTVPGVAGAPRISETAGWILRYSDEYSLQPSDEQFLNEVASITGGGQLSLASNPAAAFLHNLDQEEAALPLWPYLLALAAFVLIADIAVRRLVINRSDLDRMRETLGQTFGFGRQAAEYEATETAGRMSGLKQAKRRAMGSGEAEPAPTSTASPAASAQQDSPISKSATPRSKPQPPPQPEGTLASRLLKNRQKED